MTDWKNILERAAWTFLEGFLGSLMLPSTLVDAGVWEAALIGASLAGISALKTFLLDLARVKIGSGGE